MTTQEIAAFVEEYVEARGETDPSHLGRLWHADGRLVHPLLTAPIAGALVPAFATYVNTARPDFQWRLDDWAARGETLFLEWTTTMAVDGATVSTSGVDRMLLREGRIAEEVVYCDTLPTWSAIDPSMRRPGLIDASALR